MPGMVDIISAISQDVSAQLAAGGYLPLTDGYILVGSQHLFEQSFAPRIIFVPTVSRFAVKDPSSPNPVIGYPSAELKRERQQRAIHTEWVNFAVHVWGKTSDPNVDYDYDATQVLYQAIIIALYNKAEGCYNLTTAGNWTSSKSSATQLIRTGQEFVFGLEIATPVLDQLLPYAPSDVYANAGINLISNGNIIDHIDGYVIK